MKLTLSRILTALYGVIFITFLVLTLALKVEDATSVYMTGFLAKILEPHMNSDLLLVLAYAVCVILPYFIGSTMFAVLISKERHGKDIRTLGSKNAGMTNMFRVYGKNDGIATAVGDSLKTAAAVFLGRFVLGETGAYLAALFAVLGHMAPLWFKFRGGKGVISSGTAMLVLDPIYFAICLAVFCLVFFTTHWVSMGSIAAAFVYPAIVYYGAKIRSGGAYAATPPALIFAVFVGVMVIFMHRANIKRVYYGEEKKMYLSKKKRLAVAEAEKQLKEEKKKK